MQSWGQWAEQVPQPIQVFMKELLHFFDSESYCRDSKVWTGMFFSLCDLYFTCFFQTYKYAQFCALVTFR